MKKLLNILTCVLVILAASSCNYFNDGEPSQNTKDSIASVGGISQEIKNKIAAQDTLMNALVLKVDTLAQTLTLVQKENAELKGQIKKLESPKSTWGYMTLVTIAIAILALILSLLRKGISKEEVDKIFSQNLDKSKRITKLKTDVSQLSSRQNNNVSTFRDFERRLKTVESKLIDLSILSKNSHNVPYSTVNRSQEDSRQSKEPEYPKMCYANINSGSFFTQIYNSAQEGCVFSIKLNSLTKGEFNIISLDKIKSRNMWQEIVEYTGSIEDATSFKVEDYGICEKYDDVTWQVTKKLKIKLLK